MKQRVHTMKLLTKAAGAFQNNHQIQVDVVPLTRAQVNGSMGYHSDFASQHEVVYVPCSITIQTDWKSDVVLAAFELANALQVPIRIVSE